MRKTKKQLLGLAGLAAVGIMTVVACAMPAPDAAAADQSGYECNDSDDDASNDCAKGSGGAQVQVYVGESEFSSSTVYPLDGSTLVDPELEVSTRYTEVTRIDYYLTYKKTGSDFVRRINLKSFEPADDNGLHTFSVNLAQYGYGEYALHSIAYGYNGSGPREDIVKFNFSALTAKVASETADNGDPLVDLTVNGEVDRVYMQVYDQKGNPLFKDADGNEQPILVSRDEIDPETGKAKIQLPFAENGIPAGDYELVAWAEDADDTILSLVTDPFTYEPLAPEVPNAGAGFLADLNITHVDYLLTGLLAFGLVAGFALYLVHRKSRR